MVFGNKKDYSKIEKLVCILLCLAMLGGLAGCGNVKPGETAIAEPAVKVNEAAKVVDDMTFGWNLGNTLDAFYGNNGVLHDDGVGTENCWGNPCASQTLIDGVKSTGINVIRIPVTWYNHMDPQTYEVDEAWMKRVEEVVNYALDEDTYVILNMHHDTGTEGWLHASDNNLEQKKDIYEAVWKQISLRFEGYSKNLLFESFNEILNEQNEWSRPDSRAIEIVNELNQLFVDTVRGSGEGNSDRILIVNSYCAGMGVAMLKNFEIPADTIEGHIIAEVHSYTPYHFTAPEYPNVKTWSESDVDPVLKYVNTRFSELGVPVIIGEFGAVPKGNEAELYSWAEYSVKKAYSYGIKCCWWDNGIQSEFAVFDRNTGEVSKPELMNIMLTAAGVK